MEYIYKFIEKRKINATTTRLAHVLVYTIKGKHIGTEIVWSSQTPEQVVDMIVRDYELSKIWNSKKFSFNQ